MVVDRDEVHSTLEPVPQQSRYQAEQRNPLPSDPGKQIALDPGKQIAIDGGKQCIENDNGGLEVAPQNDFDRQNTQVHHVLAQRLSAKTKGGMIGLILLIILGVLIILGAILGGLLGSRRDKGSETASSTSLSNSSAPSPSVTPTQRKIAAVSFIPQLSGSNYTSRVYFQDDEGQIMEAQGYDHNATWLVNKIGIGGKKGSAIAAAVSLSRPLTGLPLEISLFYLDVNNLIHDITYTDSTGNWTPGTLSAQGYTTMPNSSLSAMYHWCRLCANTTIIAFQDKNGFVQIGNHTSRGWTLNQLGQDLEPVMGTGLALQPFYRSGWLDQINLYHQKSLLNLSLASWNTVRQEVNGWSLNEQVYNPIPSGSPIAAASSYSNLSTGFETWIEVLSLSTTGIVVDTWSGKSNDWLTHDGHPSAMANSTENMKTYESVAVTAIGNAFAVVKQDGRPDAIEYWQVANDLVDWTLTGNVDLDVVKNAQADLNAMMRASDSSIDNFFFYAASGTPLHPAKSVRNATAVQVLIDYGLNVNIRPFDNGETPPELAAKLHLSDIAEILLHHGANIRDERHGGIWEVGKHVEPFRWYHGR
ncbi:hypothetical protein MMC29_006921 [Sticta canariensis]|nr:hypothetical protein [Sticta canariensis]